MNRPFEFLGIVASGYAVKDDLMNGHSTGGQVRDDIDLVDRHIQRKKRGGCLQFSCKWCRAFLIVIVLSSLYHHKSRR